MKDDAINIYDIAKMANVSIATVSRVMNGSDKVTEKTKKKVMDVIENVGYTPNAYAQGLVSKTMHTVGVMVPTISDPYMASAVAYLERELMKYGFECILGCSGYDQEGKQKKTEMLLAKQIDCLIYVGSTFAGNGKDTAATDYIREAAKRVPVFIINGNVNGENIYVSVCEDEAAVFDVTNALISRGRKEILFLTDAHSYSANKKRKGFEKAMKAAGYNAKKGIIYVENNLYSVCDQLILMENITCDAVVASNDVIAVGAVKYAAKKGIKIPEEIEIVGYNNSVLAISSTPEITSIDNHTAEICKNTVERIMDLLNGEAGGLVKKVSVTCTLVPRKTTVQEWPYLSDM